MRIPIIYGRHHYCRKIVKPQDLGILAPLGNIEHFEYTQRYGHLYWIPLFPIGAAWHARGKDNKLYEINAALLSHLSGIRSSWYSLLIAFLGPILGFGGWGIYCAKEAYQEHEYKVYREAEDAREYKERIDYITHPAINDYYCFHNESRDEHAKVLAFNDTAIKLSHLQINPAKMPMPQVIALLSDTTDTYSDWISKRTLLELAKQDKREEIGLLGAGTFYVDGVIRLGEPILEYYGASNMDHFSLGLRSKGKNLTITSLTGASSSYVLPDLWQYDDSRYFEMKKDPGEKFAFNFTCEDDMGKIYKYRVSGNKDLHSDVIITKLP